MKLKFCSDANAKRLTPTWHPKGVGPQRKCQLLLHCMQELIVDPVVAADGQTYEQHALQTWLKYYTTSPVTGDCLSNPINDMT